MLTRAKLPKTALWPEISGVNLAAMTKQRKTAPDAARVKEIAKELGADLVGIASARTLNAFPPDPRYPQTPEGISPRIKSVIVVVQHIPAAVFRCKQMVPVQYMDMVVLRRMDKVAARIAMWLEENGYPAFVTAAQETDWNMKKASYGYLSTRHLGIEAGLGTFGLEVNILTPEYGPRVYLTGILTELELEPDRPMTEQVCIGEGCSRCLYSCPGDAVEHWDINKPACASFAQEFGYMTVTAMMQKFALADNEEKRRMIRSRDLFGFWQGLLRVVGSFGDCPRCLAVCPVGTDYHAFLAEDQKIIPEQTKEKVAKGKAFLAARREGEDVPGLNEWNIRWVGPDGYTGKAAKRVRQTFRDEQRRLAEKDGG
jgi:epoxyqueuosine reductase QueG